MRLPQVAWCVVLGILPLVGLPRLPDLLLTKGMIVLAVFLLFFRTPGVRTIALTLLFFCWGCLAAHQTLWPVNALTGKNQQAEIVITATDGQTTHQGKIIRLNGKRQFPAIAVSLYGNYLPQLPCAGQRWEMTIRMRPVHGQLNEGGFDSQRTALARHTAISGRFLSATVLDASCSWRARHLASLTASLADLPWQPVILALGAGERMALPAEVKRLLQQTGTSHLMAISGLHIALVASLGWLLVRALQFFLPCHYINWRAPLLAGFGCALCYALFTGLQPPALRTIAALAILYSLRLRGRHWSPWSAWICCIGAILFVDPLAVLSQSLWLSAFAVATLIFWYQWMPVPAQALPPWSRWLAGLLHLQLGLMLLLMPLQVALFHGISLSSMAANLVAVPVVTFVVVPLILAGMLLHLIGLAVVETGIWLLTDRVLALLFGFLTRLPDGWLDLDMRWLPATILPWLGLIAWKLRGWKSAPALCAAAIAVLTFPLWSHKPSEEWRVTMLDVGQGLAVVIDRHDKAILYDTGLAWPGGDSGQQLIIPWLRWHHLQPEGIILSHEHLDHRGGLNSLTRAWPQAWVRSPLGWGGHQSCFRGDHWQWEGLTFRVLWPLPGTQTQGNNRSCVVRVDDGKYSILLTGDIELSAEFSMLSHYWQHLTSTLIQVPHHGSSTSSGEALLQRVGGQAALASASRYNAWRLPSEKIVKRYRQQGYQWFDTPHQGQLSVLFQRDNWQICSLRDQILPRWYHQWFGVSRDNG